MMNSAEIVLLILQGKISFNNLKRVAKELGENLTDEELQVRVFSWVVGRERERERERERKRERERETTVHSICKYSLILL